MPLRLSQAVPLMILLGCARGVVVGGAPGGDAGARDMAATDAGTRDLAMPLVCGDTPCGPEAESCCPVPNCETGGEDLICPRGAFNCPDVEDCPPPPQCAPFDARGEGVCALGLGVAWNGATCEFLSGCECVGADCGELYVDLLACFRGNADCERNCGSGPPCGPGTYCDYADDGCGIRGDEGVCLPRPEACDDILAPVCACDGQTYDNACTALQQGLGVLRDGEC
ncbi:MAG: Kazal-type serine protease inhibitor domain-containing protein [Myxococcota bacterium]